MPGNLVIFSMMGNMDQVGLLTQNSLTQNMHKNTQIDKDFNHCCSESL